MVLKLKKALNGLNQFLSERNATPHKFLWDDLKMTRLITEQCIYVRFNKEKTEYIILAVYVYNIVISDTIQEAIKPFEKQITAKYECKDLGRSVINRCLKPANFYDHQSRSSSTINPLAFKTIFDV